MNRKKKLILNTVFPVINKVIAFLCGLVLPRLFIKTYGSDVNGLIASITNFLGMIALLDMGMGTVVESSLYKPLAQKNEYEVSKIVKSCKSFFNKIALVLLAYLSVLVIIYPTIIRNDFGWLFEASLLIILSIDLFANYFFGIAYSILLKADQKAYIPMILSCMGTVLNFICSVVLITINVPVHIVKLASAAVFLIKPLFLNLYVHKHYNLLKDVDITEEPIKQKWNGVAQHFAYYVTDKTDVLVLTVFSTLSNVSIYVVYNMVVVGIRDIIIMTQSGVQALIGNLLASDEREQLLITFDLYEWFVHNVSTILYTCTAILILPFVKIYTYNITDANYIQPVFAMILIAAVYMYCLRFPYHIMVLAAGHFKQTQTSSIIEMFLNIILTIILVFKYGLVGVSIGTFVSLTYRTVYLVHYNHNIIYEYKVSKFYKLLLSNSIIIAISIGISKLVTFDVVGYINWAVYAIIILFIVTAVCFVVNCIFCRDDILFVFRFLNNRRRQA